MRVAGVDGCHGGWLAALCHAMPPPQRVTLLDLALYPTFSDLLLTAQRLHVLALDMPIGLLDAPTPGGRDCDRLARQLLHKRRGSIFTPPIRRALAATTYRSAARLNGRGLSRQTFHILPKLAEVDRLMTPAQQEKVYEAHPELAFMRLAGRPLRHPKKTLPGRRERMLLLSRAFDLTRTQLRTLLEGFARTRVAPDDVLDALALAITAARIAQGQAKRLPMAPPKDRKGLRMEILY